ncbi:hypothetical protein [Rhizobium tubonense]|nr:hypothetical protein [Rhizobium tubonense]
MDERKNYLNSDKLQADDELSPMPSQDGAVPAPHMSESLNNPAVS